MNKKLPNVYHNSEPIKSNNKNVFISYQEENSRNNESKEEKVNNSLKNEYVNYYKFFNRQVKITLTNNEIISTKILSKKDNKLLLSNGTYLHITDIKNID